MNPQASFAVDLIESTAPYDDLVAKAGTAIKDADIPQAGCFDPLRA